VGVAYIRKQYGKWRAEGERKGVRRSKTCRGKGGRDSVGRGRESEVITADGARFPPKTLADTLDRYAEEVNPRKRPRRPRSSASRASSATSPI
jgi:hypothetical protein